MAKKTVGYQYQFGADEQSVKLAPIVLSSNFTLPVLFSRGCLLPAVFGEATGISFFDRSLTRLPIAYGQIPENWASAVEGAVRNAFPIGLQLKRVEGPREITFEHQSPIQFVLLGDVDSIVFRSETEKERFLSWSFADFDLKRIAMRMQVDPLIFKGAQENLEDHLHPPSETSEIGATAPSALRRADALAAVFVTLVNRAPASRDWMKGLSSFLNGSPGSDFKAELAPLSLLTASSDNAQSVNNLEQNLWQAASSTVLSYPLSEGWPAGEVLEKIHLCAQNGVTDDEALKQLNVWFLRSRAVLGSEVDVSDLSDKELSLVRRALLLLVLRGDVDSLLETPPSTSDSALMVGQKVYLLALSLAAARVGLRALPVSLKCEEAEKNSARLISELATILVRYVASFLNGTVDFPKPSLRLSYESFGPLDGFWVLEADRERVLVRKAEVDPRLLRVFAMSKQLGYELRESIYGGLQITVKIEQSSFEVMIELLPSAMRSQDVVRFRCDLSDKVGGRNRRRMQRVVHGKKCLQALLEANWQDSINCRFGLDPETGQICAIVDQQLGTMDEEEFRWHLENVANATKEGRLILHRV